MLLEQPEMDFYTHDKEEKNPSSIAAETGHDGCVTLLLRAGVKPYVTTRRVPRDENEKKCRQMIEDKFALMQHDRLKLYYQVNVPSEKCAKDHINAKQSPLHAAIINYQSIRVLDAILNNEMVDVDQKDEDGNTALILASNKDEDNILTSDEVSKLRKLSVGLLLSRGADINITNEKKRTALMTAVIAGNVEVVRLLVENMAHMDVQDEDGKTCLDLVNECKQETSRNEIKSLLQSEEQKRASSVDFRDEYVKTYLSMTQTEALVQGGFSKVVNCSPEFARTFLDDYVEVHRHNFKFSQLLEVYGKNVKTSVLYSILNLKSKDPNLVMDACKVC
ncbi:hypothetical protein AeRB84_005914 [Aphanomyces euteiches]|nr:hypothetical protein AeRB84_005914 [Aphanomyces euteiches]